MAHLGRAVVVSLVVALVALSCPARVGATSLRRHDRMSQALVVRRTTTETMLGEACGPYFWTDLPRYFSCLATYIKKNGAVDGLALALKEEVEFSLEFMLKKMEPALKRGDVLRGMVIDGSTSWNDIATKAIGESEDLCREIGDAVDEYYKVPPNRRGRLGRALAEVGRPFRNGLKMNVRATLAVLAGVKIVNDVINTVIIQTVKGMIMGIDCLLDPAKCFKTVLNNMKCTTFAEVISDGANKVGKALGKEIQKVKDIMDFIAETVKAMVTKQSRLKKVTFEDFLPVSDIVDNMWKKFFEYLHCSKKNGKQVCEVTELKGNLQLFKGKLIGALLIKTVKEELNKIVSAWWDEQNKCGAYSPTTGIEMTTNNNLRTGSFCLGFFANMGIGVFIGASASLEIGVCVPILKETDDPQLYQTNLAAYSHPGLNFQRIKFYLSPSLGLSVGTETGVARGMGISLGYVFGKPDNSFAGMDGAGFDFGFTGGVSMGIPVIGVGAGVSAGFTLGYGAGDVVEKLQKGDTVGCLDGNLESLTVSLSLDVSALEIKKVVTGASVSASLSAELSYGLIVGHCCNNGDASQDKCGFSDADLHNDDICKFKGLGPKDRKRAGKYYRLQRRMADRQQLTGALRTCQCRGRNGRVRTCSCNGKQGYEDKGISQVNVLSIMRVEEDKDLRKQAWKEWREQELQAFREDYKTWSPEKKACERLHWQERDPNCPNTKSDGRGSYIFSRIAALGGR